MLVYEVEGNTGVPGEKPLEAKERANNKLNAHMASMRGFKRVPHSWQETALTTLPSLEPRKSQINTDPVSGVTSKWSISVAVFHVK